MKRSAATNDDELENPEMLARFLDHLLSEGEVVTLTASRTKRLAELTAGVLIDD